MNAAMVSLPSVYMSCIFLVDSPADVFHSLKSFCANKQEACRFVFNELFKLEHAQEVVRLSYLQTQTPLWMLVGAQSYNDIAQNYLLKIIEEPPKHIFYVFLAPNKSSLLPTIRSRLPIMDYRTHVRPAALALDIDNLDMKQIYVFLKQLIHEKPNKEELKDKIAALLLSCSHLHLSRQDLESFDKAMRLAESFERAEYVFAPLLLRILEHRRKNA